MTVEHDLPDDRLKALKRRLHGSVFEHYDCEWDEGEVQELAAEFGKAVDERTGGQFGWGRFDVVGGILHNPTDYGMVYCFNPDCKAHLDPDIGKFCPACGEAFEREARDKAEVPLVDCPECGESVAAAKFCEECGASLADENEGDEKREGG